MYVVPVVVDVRSPDITKHLGSLAKEFSMAINPNPSDAMDRFLRVRAHDLMH
jgi:hypothetical protein